MANRFTRNIKNVTDITKLDIDRLYEGDIAETIDNRVYVKTDNKMVEITNDSVNKVNNPTAIGSTYLPFELTEGVHTLNFTYVIQDPVKEVTEDGEIIINPELSEEIWLPMSTSFHIDSDIPNSELSDTYYLTLKGSYGDSYGLVEITLALIVRNDSMFLYNAYKTNYETSKPEPNATTPIVTTGGLDGVLYLTNWKVS